MSTHRADTLPAMDQDIGPEAATVTVDEPEISTDLGRLVTLTHAVVSDLGIRRADVALCIDEGLYQAARILSREGSVCLPNIGIVRRTPHGVEVDR